jgi:ABC-type Fe3+ transport system substrate-binding protein
MSLALLFLTFSLTSVIELRAQVSGRELLRKLVEGARKEGQLDYFTISSMGERGVREIATAFNKRFNLNIRFNTDLSGGEDEKFSQALMEVASGLPASYDVLQGPEHRPLGLWEKKGIEHVDNWDAILKEIAPEAFEVKEKISPLILAGYAFAFGNRVKAINYRTDLIKEEELPRTRKELGNPKYKGMYPMEKWLTPTQYGILVYPKDEWLKIVRAGSWWKPPILHYPVAVQRMMAGEFKFMPSNAYYVFQVKAKNPKAPIGLAFFGDVTPVTYVLHLVRKGAKHPNAAKLFALWATSPEAQRIWENVEYASIENLMLKQGTGPMSTSVREAVTQKNIKLISWWDSKESLDSFLWYATKEGTEYSRVLEHAQFGRD